MYSELVNSSDDGARLLWLEFRQVKQNWNSGIFYKWLYLFYSREKKKSTWEKILNLWSLSSTHFCQLRYDKNRFLMMMSKRKNKRAEAAQVPVSV